MEPAGGVHLVEEWAHVDVGHIEETEPGWYLDTMASNHMIGSRAAFSELDTTCTTLSNWVTARWSPSRGDARPLSVQGWRSPHAPWVYYTPRLRNIIVSMGQLD